MVKKESKARAIRCVSCKTPIKLRINRSSSGSKRPGIVGGSRECRAGRDSDRILHDADDRWRAAC